MTPGQSIKERIKASDRAAIRREAFAEAALLAGAAWHDFLRGANDQAFKQLVNKLARMAEV